MGKRALIALTAAVLVPAALAAAAVSTYTEDFESGFTLGVPVGNHADWYSGPNVNTGLGVAGSIGWNYSGNPATWTGIEFDWSGSQFNSYTVGMDFRTDASGHFDDDRVGFSIYNPTTDSSNVMSVQMDPGGGGASGYNIEGYWDGVGGTDKRPSFVDLPVLTADTWYRLTTVFTKTAVANEPIIAVDLQSLDAAGSPTGSVASATLDTSTLVAADRPHTKYFSGSISPAYKNYNSGLADNALAIIDDDTPPPPPIFATCYFDEPPEGTRDWTPGVGDEDLGFATTIISGTPHTLGVYDSASSPWRYRMRTCEAEVTMDTVDLSMITDATVAIEVLIANTSWEADDYFLVTVTNGTDTIEVANESGTLGGLAKDSWIHYEVAIPDAWTQATLEFSSSSNSSADSEVVNFDNIEFRGVPEPATIALLALGGLALLRKRRIA